VNQKAPKDDQWQFDPFEVDMVYQDVMTSGTAFGGTGRLKANQNKILEWTASSVVAALNSCKSAAIGCVKSVCGSGSLASCYGQSLGANGKLDFGTFAARIQEDRCKTMVNTNQNCRDFLIERDDTVSSIWNMVWGTTTDTWTGAFGIPMQLFNDLSYMFNDAAVRNVFLQCQNETDACIRRECGSDFLRCYIDDPHKVGALTGNTAYGTASFTNEGMADATSRAVGGFDGTMAKNLCIFSIKRSQACMNYFDIEYAKKEKENYNWAGSWNMMGASANASAAGATDKWSSWEINSSITNADGTSQTLFEKCDATHTYTKDYERKDDQGAVVESNKTTASASRAYEFCAAQEDDIFKEVMARVAGEARGKLTQMKLDKKNACEKHKGQNSFENVYMWVPKDKVVIPNDYAEYGLVMAEIDPDDNYSGTYKELMNKFRGFSPLSTKVQATKDLWGAFCMVEVGLKSGDAKISEMFEKGKVKYKKVVEETYGPDEGVHGKNLKAFTMIFSGGQNAKVTDKEEDATFTSNRLAYFALGDSVMCGSWIDRADLESIERVIRNEAAVAEFNKTSNDWWNNHGAQIAGILGAAGGAVGGGFAGKAIGGFFGDNFNSDTNEVLVAQGSLAGVKGAVSTARGVIGSKESSCAGAADGVMQKYIENINSPVTHNGLSGISGTINVYSYTKQTNCSGPGMTWNDVASRLDSVEGEIRKIENAKPTDAANSKAKARGTWIGAAAGGLGGGLLAGGITQSAINEANRMRELKAGDAAVKAWFDNVGSKIQCTVGGRVVGSYGDIITLN
jgi:hypothetical protein